MFNNTLVQVETTNLIALIGLLLNVVIVVVAFIKLWNSSKLRTDTKIKESKEDTKEYIDDHIKTINDKVDSHNKSAEDKVESYEAYNTRAHGEMKAEINMLETRTVKAQDELRNDYVRGNESLEKLINAKFDALTSLIQAIK